MIHLITSKDNQICYLAVLTNNVTSSLTYRYCFQIHSLVTPVNKEDYESNTNKFLFNYYTETTIEEAIKNIASIIIARHAEMLNRPEDKREEEIIISACEKHINTEVVEYLEAYTMTHNLSVESIYQLMKITKYEDIITTTKRILGIEDIDLSDLVSFSYSLYNVLNSGK